MLVVRKCEVGICSKNQLTFVMFYLFIDCNVQNKQIYLFCICILYFCFYVFHPTPCTDDNFCFLMRKDNVFKSFFTQGLFRFLIMHFLKAINNKKQFLKLKLIVINSLKYLSFMPIWAFLKPLKLYFSTIFVSFLRRRWWWSFKMMPKVSISLFQVYP